MAFRRLVASFLLFFALLLQTLILSVLEGFLFIFKYTFDDFMIQPLGETLKIVPSDNTLTCFSLSETYVLSLFFEKYFAVFFALSFDYMLHQCWHHVGILLAYKMMCVYTDV